MLTRTSEICTRTQATNSSAETSCIRFIRVVVAVTINKRFQDDGNVWYEPIRQSSWQLGNPRNYDMFPNFISPRALCIEFPYNLNFKIKGLNALIQIINESLCICPYISGDKCWRWHHCRNISSRVHKASHLHVILRSTQGSEKKQMFLFGTIKCEKVVSDFQTYIVHKQPFLQFRYSHFHFI